MSCASFVSCRSFLSLFSPLVHLHLRPIQVAHIHMSEVFLLLVRFRLVLLLISMLLRILWLVLVAF
nr:MAG TPA: hypothetical protein [Inoviridae sp.]